MAYTVHQAKTNFSRILKEVEAGQEVVVRRGKKPVAKIVAFENPAPAQTPFRLMGAYRGKLQFDDSAFAPATDLELMEMGFEDLAKTPLLPPPHKASGAK